MKYCLILCFFVFTIGRAQTGAEKIMTAKSPSEAQKLARLDIINKTPALFIQGGFAPVVMQRDLAFEKKYNVNIADFGCTGLEFKIVSAYNKIIFRHLDTKHGIQWQKEIRADIIGLKEYLKKK